MGIPKFIDEQREYNEFADESNDVVQDGSTANNVEIFSSVQAKEFGSLWDFNEQLFGVEHPNINSTW